MVVAQAAAAARPALLAALVVAHGAGHMALEQPAKGLEAALEIAQMALALVAALARLGAAVVVALVVLVALAWLRQSPALP